MTIRFKQDSSYVPGVSRARFPITGTGGIRNVGTELPGSRMPIDSNHVLVYYLNEPSGTTVTNYGSAAGNNLTISGTPTRNVTSMYTRGTPATKFNKSPAAYASNNSLSGVPGVGYRSQQGFTIELTCAWTSAWSSEEGLIELGLNQLPRKYMVISRTSQTQLTAYGYSEAWNRATGTSTTIPSSSTICHLVVWWKAAELSQIKIFVNGAEVATGSNNFAEGDGTPLYLRLGTLSFGQSPYNWGDPASYATNSTIGEVRVSNIIRSDAYIQQAYQAALAL